MDVDRANLILVFCAIADYSSDQSFQSLGLNNETESFMQLMCYAMSFDAAN